MKKPTTVIFDKDGSGKRLLEIEGGQVSVQPGKMPVGVRGYRATLYQDGKPVLLLTAPQVYYDDAKKVLHAEGGVLAQTLVSTHQRRVQCDTLTWQPSSKAVRGDGRVVAHYGALAQVYGSHVDADLQLNTLDILP